MKAKESAKGCPGLVECPLYHLAHDGKRSQLGCVDDLAKPCKVARGASFNRMWTTAVNSMFAEIRAQLGITT